MPTHKEDIVALYVFGEWHRPLLGTFRKDPMYASLLADESAGEHTVYTWLEDIDGKRVRFYSRTLEIRGIQTIPVGSAGCVKTNTTSI